MPCLEKDFAKKIKEEEKIEIFIETGTYKGDTIFNMEDLFDELYTIEFGYELYSEIKNKYKGSKINFYCGDSGEKLSEILDKINKKVLFFLDAHFSEGDTSGSYENLPLKKELESIMKWNNECIIIIDDARLFNTYMIPMNRKNIIEILRERIDDIYFLPSNLDNYDRMVIALKKK